MNTFRQKFQSWMQAAAHSRMVEHVRRSPAQGMVEFALALPILLILIFGIIEFGRFMQAWLALENGARFGVRFAVTGAYNWRYCEAAAYAIAESSGIPASQILIYDRADGKDMDDDSAHTADPNCVIDPVAAGLSVEEADELTFQLVDYARLPSIRDTVLQGATGIAWSDNPAVSGTYISNGPNWQNSYLHYGWTTLNPTAPSQDYRGNPSLPGYFGISICSNRAELQPDNTVLTYRLNNNDFFYTPPPPNTSEDHRFLTYCEQVSSDGSTHRFMDDAGGPGDRVRITLVYRHELITPLINSWWPTLRISTSREGLVEKFRTSRVTGLSGAIGFAATWTRTPAPTFTPTTTLTSTPTETPYPCGGDGALRQTWTGIGSGNAVSDLTGNVRYPNDPNTNDFITDFDSYLNTMEQYGQRVIAQLCAPYTGTYTFWIASDDNSELWLSSDLQYSNAVRIARVGGWTDQYQWFNYADQHSGPQSLVAGQRVLIYALHKEGSGGDNLSVAWSGPGISPEGTPVVIAQEYLLRVTPGPTSTPSPTPLASCDLLAVVSTEKLYYGDYSDNANPFQGDGYRIRTDVQNIGPYAIYLTGASLTSSGGASAVWHNQMHATPSGYTFNCYADGTGCNIYNPADVSNYPIAHTFPTPRSVGTQQIRYFRWWYGAPTPAPRTFNFWIKPEFSSFPPVLPGTRTPTMRITPPNPTLEMQNFYWSGDMTGSLSYVVVPTGAPTLACQVTMTGRMGPSIQTTQIGSLADSFSVRALINGNDSNVSYTWFFVYNNAGQLVHWRYVPSGEKPYCLFGRSGSNCIQKVVNVDYWEQGSNISPVDPFQKITNGTYRLVIMARNDDGRKKSNLIVQTLVLQANTPTNTATRTASPTITRTPTITLTPTVTHTRTVTRTRTITRTPTVTLTPTVTRTPTRTPTATKTLEPTPCLTSNDLGGCQ